MVFGLTDGVLIYEDLKNFRNYVYLTTTRFQPMRNFFTFHPYYILKVNYQKVPNVKIIGTFLQKCLVRNFFAIIFVYTKTETMQTALLVIGIWKLLCSVCALYWVGVLLMYLDTRYDILNKEDRLRTKIINYFNKQQR